MRRRGSRYTTRQSTAYDRFIGVLFLLLSIFFAAYLAAWLVGAIIWSWDIVIVAFAGLSLALGIGGLTRLARGHPLLAPKPGRWRTFYRAALWGLFVLFIAAQTAIFSGMAQQEPDAACEVVVVLGARIIGRSPGLTLQQRLDKTAWYAKANPDSLVIACGGQGDDEQYPEAQVMKEYLIAEGIEEARIYTEGTSRNTYANLMNAMEIIGRAPESAMLISSDYHLYRARRIARRVGLSGEIRILGAAPSAKLRPFCHMREFMSVVREWIVPEKG